MAVYQAGSRRPPSDTAGALGAAGSRSGPTAGRQAGAARDEQGDAEADDDEAVEDAPAARRRRGRRSTGRGRAGRAGSVAPGSAANRRGASGDPRFGRHQNWKYRNGLNEPAITRTTAAGRTTPTATTRRARSNVADGSARWTP
jgi:hypothetical protein